ncbi:MAG: hypothetical protein LBL82_08015 [Oscillospiraceae bacterium]|jgi:hypothetical protein|nr:hypothetical protein [Oscillospiraceae bacterium]
MNNQIVCTTPVLVGVNQAAKISGKSAYSLRMGVKDGKVAFVRSGKRILIHLPRLLEQIDREAAGGLEYGR